jgi:uncharacterized membrane protein YoaK (UPF0700 family)
MGTRRIIWPIYICLSWALFLIGLLLVPESSVLTGAPYVSETFSFFSGLSLASWSLALGLLADWLMSERDEKIIRKGWLIALTLSLVVGAIILYPPIITKLISWEYYLKWRPSIIIIYAFLTALSSFQVYLLGLNADDIENQKDKDVMIRFLLSLLTLISLVSIAMTFALTSSSSSYQRALVGSSYCILPVATYSLGYLAKLFKSPIAHGLTLFLSLILGFTIGAIVMPVMVPNSFFFPAGVTLFMIIGELLALIEKGRIPIKY